MTPHKPGPLSPQVGERGLPFSRLDTPEPLPHTPEGDAWPRVEVLRPVISPD